MMATQPWMQWYTRDWMSHAGLRSVSLAARGLWADMMCIMRSDENYGYLKVGGKPLTVKALARMVGALEKECLNLLDELRDAGIFREEGDCDTRVILSPRMVRDHEKAENGAKNGRKGGNPNIKRLTPEGELSTEGVNPKVDERVNPTSGKGVNPRAATGAGKRVKPIYQTSDIRKDNINSSSSDSDLRGDRLTFPETGTIEFSDPWRSEARKLGRNIDLDLLASEFRKWLSKKNISFDAPAILQMWITFCGKHQV